MVKIKVSFPHMGNYWIAFKSLVEHLDCEVIVPPKITKRTLGLGVKYSPESACLPFKINLGNYIEAIEKGADTVLQAGRAEACRYGIYGEAHEAILHKKYENIKLVKLFERGARFNYFKALKKLNPKTSSKQRIYSSILALKKVSTIDSLEHRVRKLRAYELEKGSADAIFEKSLESLDKARSIKDVKRVRKNSHEELDNIDIDETRQPLKVGIVGELYVVMEPFVNLGLEKQLAELGVEVIRPLCLSSMIKDAVFPWQQRRIINHGREFIRYDLGAHAGHTVGHAVEFSENSFDGVIQVYPFTCMPEQSAREILPRVSEKFKKPILSLSFDEHTAKTGMTTRIEAFIETLYEKHT